MARLPPDIQQILNELDDAERAADALVADLSDEQFHWQPERGASWSIGQCLDHLATINVLYGRAIRGAVLRARERGWTRHEPLAPGPFGRWFIRSQEPPVTRRFRAPAKVSPRSSLAREEVIRRYKESHDAFRQIVCEAGPIDANRATFRNPFVGLIRVKVATGLHVVTAHERRHLWQADQVKARPDFPRGVNEAATGR